MGSIDQKKHLSLHIKSEKCSIQIGDLCINGFISTSGVANFLNIPYASIPSRFRTANALALSQMKGDLDASQYGPRCPQCANSAQGLLGNMFEQLSVDQLHSEMNCLHLNIYAPPKALGSSQKLPVLAVIHGGGFNSGDNTTEFDGNHLVKRSIELGKPIVIVSINYRLNILGFLTSRELIAEAEDKGEVPVINQGLHDQRLALQWIRSSIYHFGGSGDNLSLSGESAGAASVWYHLKGKVPLFNQAIIQSSPPPNQRSLEKAQAEFDKLVLATGTSLTSPYQVKLAAVRSIPIAELMTLWDSFTPCEPVFDPSWFADFSSSTISTSSYWGTLPSWCPRAILGYNTDEAALFIAVALANLTSTQLKSYLHSFNKDPRFASILLSSRPFRDSPTPLNALVTYVTEALFVRSTMEFADIAVSQPGPAKVWVYQLDVKDPFPGPLHNYTWHSMGLPIMFRQPPCMRASAELAATAENMTELYTDFIYGKEPWEAYNVRGRKWLWKGEKSVLSDGPHRDEFAELFAPYPELTEAYKSSASHILGCIFNPDS